MDLPQQLTSQLKGMERLVDGQTGAIPFRHPELRGTPDLVLEGNGYTLEPLTEPLKDQLPVGGLRATTALLP